jgi:hypothetical protein
MAATACGAMFRRVSRVRDRRDRCAAMLNCVYVGVQGRCECCEMRQHALSRDSLVSSPRLLFLPPLLVSVHTLSAEPTPSPVDLAAEQRAPNPGDPPFALAQRAIWPIHHPEI